MEHIKLKRGKKNQNKKISSENQLISSTLKSIVKKKKGRRKNQEMMTKNSTKMNAEKETVTKMVPIKGKTTSKQSEKEMRRGEEKRLKILDLTMLSIKREVSHCSSRI